MAHEKLIAFLEEEARILRNRIAGLARRDIIAGVPTGDGEPTTAERLEAEAKARLAEIEEHLRELKAHDRPHAA
ncbi:MAG TPA: hypothetical protein GYA10_02870 [Alphaproteobacteria bacterium]|nr:hypothetical protein [Alphaproteobacteria bacterium]